MKEEGRGKREEAFWFGTLPDRGDREFLSQQIERCRSDCASIDIKIALEVSKNQEILQTIMNHFIANSEEGTISIWRQPFSAALNINSRSLLNRIKELKKLKLITKVQEVRGFNAPTTIELAIACCN